MNIRARIIVKGKVQAGGYRVFIEEAAYNNRLTGRVWNQDDGTVRIICEGQKRDIRKFLKSIRLDDFMVRVRDMDVEMEPATGEFEYFDRIPDTDPSRAILERADAAARALRALDGHLSGEIREAGRSVSSVGSDVKDMNRSVGGHFNRLDRRYDSFGRTLKTVSKDMKGMNSSLKTVSKDMKGMKSSMSSVASDTKALRRAAVGRGNGRELARRARRARRATTGRTPAAAGA